MAEVDINQSYRWLGGIFRQVFSLQGDISPAQITADQDDYNPTGLSTAAILRLSTDATRNINGIAGGADGRIIKIVNVGTQGIVLKDEASTSTAANRFALNSDVTISESQAVELWYDSTSSRWRLFGGTGGTTVVTPDQENGLVSGGTVTWIVNYDYEVSESFYYIDGVLYHSPRTTVTLDAADPTDDRIDLFVLTTSNTATKVTGIASTPPAEPSYDPSTQLKISFATVDNGTTQPTVTQTWIYRENAGTPTEWAYTDNTANLNPASTTNPYAGTIDIEGTSVAVNDYFELTPLTAPTFGTYDALVFKIRSKANWTNTRFITVRFYSGTTAVGSPAQLGGGSFGFDSTNTTDYQNVTIPLTTFGSFTTADRVRFIRTGSTGTIGFYIDDIQLMLTGTGGTTTLIPINGLLNATNVNTIENLNFLQEWQWNTIAGSTGLKLSSTSTLAASNLQKLFELALSGANVNASQITYGLYVSNIHTGTTPRNIAIFGTVANGTSSGAGVYGEAQGIQTGVQGSSNSSGKGVLGTSSTGIGGNFTSGSGTALVAESTTGLGQSIIINPATTNTSAEALRVERRTSGAAGSGIGVIINLYNEADDNSGYISAQIESTLQVVAAATRSGSLRLKTTSVANSLERLSLFGNYTALTEATATTFLRVNIPTGQVTGGEILITVEANDATDFQARTLRFIWSAVNKAGTTTITVGTPEEVVAVSAGTLTVTITAVDAGSGNIDFKADATSSLTQTTLRANYQLTKNFGTGVITPQ